MSVDQARESTDATPQAPQSSVLLIAVSFISGVALVAAAFAVFPILFPERGADAKSIVEAWGSSIVRIFCEGDLGERWSGSGTLWNVGGYFLVTTNRHVAESPSCTVMVTPFRNGVSDTGKSLVYVADPTSYRTLEGDLDFISFSLFEQTSDAPLSFLTSYAHTPQKSCTKTLYSVGERILILGYPAVGTLSGAALTVNEGIISGVERGYSGGQEDAPYTWYVTSGKIESGNSGGAALASDGCFIGVPTWSEVGSLESQGRLLIYSGESSFISSNLGM